MIGLFGNFTVRYLKTEKQKAYLEFFGVALFLVLLLGLVMRPAVPLVFSLQQNLIEGQRLNQSLDQKIVSLSQAQSNYDKVLGNLTILENTLPSKALILDFLNSLSVLAATNGVNLVESFYQEPRATAAIVGRPFDPQSALQTQAQNSALSFPFTVRLKGDYLQLRKFVSDLEKLPRLLIIDTFDFNKEVKDNSLEMLLSGRAFWLETEGK